MARAGENICADWPENNTLTGSSRPLLTRGNSEHRCISPVLPPMLILMVTYQLEDFASLPEHSFTIAASVGTWSLIYASIFALSYSKHILPLTLIDLVNIHADVDEKQLPRLPFISKPKNRLSKWPNKRNETNHYKKLFKQQTRN
ncbi:hypothetical protein V8F06_010009 [Rhypophila decipiens]